jgi:hypothetical protein
MIDDMRDTTEIEKRYSPVTPRGQNDVDVRISVDGPDDEDPLALAAELREAVADAHRGYREGGDDD